MNSLGRVLTVAGLSVILVTTSLSSQGSSAIAIQPHETPLTTSQAAAQTNVANPELSAKDRLEVFQKVWQEINDNYYDATFKGVDWPAMQRRYLPIVESAKTDREFYAALNRMAGELHDAHTRVLSPTQLKNLRSQQSVTPGFQIDELEGKLVITSVNPDSEAARAGIEPGLIIVTVNGQPVADRIAALRKSISTSSSDRYDQLRIYGAILGGEIGSSLKLELQKPDGSKFQVAVTRQVIPEPNQLQARLLPSGYALISFNQFTPEIAEKLKNRLTEFRSAPGLILDLRVNSGGSNRGLYPMIGPFFNKRLLFLRNTTRTGKPFPELPLELYFGHEGGQVYSGPVVILISARSGSTTEMFAAGMQETGRAKALGTQTCGCVVGINKQRELKGGGMLHISEVLWLTPKGRKLEGEGVVPDKVVVPTISDLQQKRDRVLAEAEKALSEMSSRERQ